MDHSQASQVLSEYSTGSLDSERAAELEAHLGTCAECRDALATLEGIRAEVRDHGSALFTPHPSPEELAALALAPAEVAGEARAAVERHVRACPTCGREVTLARKAGATAWRRALPARLVRPDEGPITGWLRAVPALVAVALAYPAYQGWVELPRERARAAREPVTSPAEPIAPRAPAWSGAAKALVLSGPTRGEDAPPAVRPEPGQPYLPLVLAVDPEALSRLDRATVAIHRAGGALAWSHEARVASLWDPRNRVASLLVPLSALPPAEYRLELRAPAPPVVLFTARFRVEAVAP